MLLLSKVRDFSVFYVFYMFERPNLRGRGRPCSPDWLRQICQRVRGQICQSDSWEQGQVRGRLRGRLRGRGERPNSHTASHILSCDLSEPIRGARPLTHTASQICESEVRSDSGRCNAFSREISQTAPRI